MYNGIKEDIEHTYTLTLSYDGNTINYVTLLIKPVRFRSRIFNVQQAMDASERFMWINMDRNGMPDLTMNINDLETEYKFKINCPINDNTYKDYLTRIVRHLSKLTYTYTTPDNIIYVPDQETKDILKRELDKEGVKLEYVSDELDTVGELIEIDILKNLKPMHESYDKNLEAVETIYNANNFHEYMLEQMIVPIKKFDEGRRLINLKGDF
jgi:hypothetical protein